MKLSDILSGVSVAAFSADADADVKDVVNRSDIADENSVFCAYKGEYDNGEDHIEEALLRGCKTIVCESGREGGGYITVKDAKTAYAQMCAHINGDPQNELRLAAVTGTNGKTTVTSMLAHILKTIHGAGSASLIGGVKNDICGKITEATRTTPDPHELYKLLADSVKYGGRYAVLEASSHALDYGKLVPCRFDVGAMTNLTEDHLDYHKSMDAYFKSKQKLIPLCRNFVSNADDYYTAVLDCPHFSLYDGEFTARITMLDRTGSEFEYSGINKALCRINVCGKFNVYNALTALCMAELLGEDAETSAAALAGFKGAAGRFEMHKSVNGADVIIDYAHTPDALENALVTARGLTKNRLICLFGCGGDRDRGKRKIMGAVSSRLADLTVITSDNSRSEEPEDIIKDILSGVDKHKKYKVIVNRKEAILYALSYAKDGDVLLLAGKGHENYETDKNGTHPFSEARIINEFNSGGNLNGNNDSKRSGRTL